MNADADKLLRQAWRQFVADTGATEDRPYPADQFGDLPELGDILGRLAADGTKRATCSALAQWDVPGKPLPAPGDRRIVLDGAGRPLCIIEITAVEVRPYNEVDAAFALDEGEDDRSLASWHRAHWPYFQRVLPALGVTPTEDMPVVCQWFRCVYRW
ncbi:MAG: ASCH domain-containing protein [Gammaproteobacteria bacterium]|nr:ASCH domain-containing protein [Gammaproteobacteria bacterium]NNM00828.1 ASCH domain-containing protein [Gammaproteobacteria bacterium]